MLFRPERRREAQVSQGGENCPAIGVIARSGARVRERRAAIGMENEDASQLQCVALDADLAKAGATGAQSIAPRRRAQQAREVAAQLGRRVSASLRVHQQGKREFLFVAEGGGLARIAVPDHHELGPARVNLRQDVAQLRDLLAAEDSAEVTDENQNDGSLAPQGAESHAASIGIEQFQTGQACRDFHGRTVRREGLRITETACRARSDRTDRANQCAGADCDRNVQPMSL